jgi:DNA-directed RNA polymerase sigma subunit (sigma70/sigma32)
MRCVTGQVMPEQIIIAQTELVVSVASAISKEAISFLDLIQENELLRAVPVADSRL